MPDTSKKVVTRFAPSPTGDPHIGSLRNALYSWIFARQHDGRFLLRVDDTDRARYQEWSEQGIFDMLKWVGFDYDDTWKQSDRLEVYRKFAQQLVESGHAYYCFCTSKRLEELRTSQREKKQPPRYDRRCFELNSADIQQKLVTKNPHVIRFKIPDDGETTVQDVVRGTVEFKNTELDDFVILKSDGFPTYHLATVVDDNEKGVTHVIRSEEWLSSLPKHVLIYQAFGWDVPVFAHLPLILAPDKSKLSKRHGATGIDEFKQLGYLPEALLNFVLLLGWHPQQGSEQEIFSREEMLAQFSLDDVQKSGAIFDYQKLDWMNAEYIRATETLLLVDLAQPFLEGYQDCGIDMLAAVELEKERIKKLSDLAEALRFLYDEHSFEPELLVWKKSDKEAAVNRLITLVELIKNIEEKDWNESTLERIIKGAIEKENLGTGDTLWPMRVALTGQKHSPGPFEVAAVLGKDKSIVRLQRAVEVLGTD